MKANQVRLFQVFARIALVFMVAGCLLVPAQAQGWKAGVARQTITPPELMWMSGYAGRTGPAESTLQELFAKALVLEDPQGNRACLVTLDLVGVGRETSLAIRALLTKQYGLEPRQVALNCSHTHCGPVVGTNLGAMYALDDAQQSRVIHYEQFLIEKAVEVVGQSLESLAPAAVSYGQGWTSFAVNRRNNPEADVPTLRAAGRLVGPVDHDVPVLAVRDEQGVLRAVAFGYACHATVMGFMQWFGDYPGCAQAAFEEAHPDCVALFWAGCGGDQNPLPRREVALAEQYGRQLAAEVDSVLAGVMQPLTGELDARYEEIPLAFASLPTRDELVATAQSDNKYEAIRARNLLADVDRGQALSPTYPYPVQVWNLGPELRWVFLGGEVVVDFALRLKAEHGREATWVAGYSNDVMAYIPSLRVLREGGYEGAGAMVYYGRPAPWAESVEESIVEAVRGQVK